MSNIFRVLCEFSDNNVQSEFEKIISRVKSGENPRVDENKLSINYFPIEGQGYFYDAVITDISDKATDHEAVKKLLNIEEQFPHSQIIVVCDLNLRDYVDLSTSLKETKSYYFGTELDAINRILNMQYLFERDLHLL